MFVSFWWAADVFIWGPFDINWSTYMSTHRDARGLSKCPFGCLKISTWAYSMSTWPAHCYGARRAGCSQAAGPHVHMAKSLAWVLLDFSKCQLWPQSQTMPDWPRHVHLATWVSYDVHVVRRNFHLGYQKFKMSTWVSQCSDNVHLGQWIE